MHLTPKRLVIPLLLAGILGVAPGTCTPEKLYTFVVPHNPEDLMARNGVPRSLGILLEDGSVISLTNSTDPKHGVVATGTLYYTMEAKDRRFTVIDVDSGEQYVTPNTKLVPILRASGCPDTSATHLLTEQEDNEHTWWFLFSTKSDGCAYVPFGGEQLTTRWYYEIELAGQNPTDQITVFNPNDPADATPMTWDAVKSHHVTWRWFDDDLSRTWFQFKNLTTGVIFTSPSKTYINAVRGDDNDHVCGKTSLDNGRASVMLLNGYVMREICCHKRVRIYVPRWSGDDPSTPYSLRVEHHAEANPPSAIAEYTGVYLADLDMFYFEVSRDGFDYDYFSYQPVLKVGAGWQPRVDSDDAHRLIANGFRLRHVKNSVPLGGLTYLSQVDDYGYFLEDEIDTTDDLILQRAMTVEVALDHTPAEGAQVFVSADNGTTWSLMTESNGLLRAYVPVKLSSPPGEAFESQATVRYEERSNATTIPVGDTIVNGEPICYIDAQNHTFFSVSWYEEPFTYERYTGIGSGCY